MAVGENVWDLSFFKGTEWVARWIGLLWTRHVWIDLGLNKGCGWFFNVLGAPAIFL